MKRGTSTLWVVGIVSALAADCAEASAVGGDKVNRFDVSTRWT